MDRGRGDAARRRGAPRIAVGHRARIAGAQPTATCPGRTLTNVGYERQAGTYTDGPDVNVLPGVLGIGDVGLAYTQGEVYKAVARQLKAKSPLARTVFVELANGQANSAYIPTDDAFGRYTFQVLGSRLKPGCAESRTIRSPCLNRVSAAGRESAEPTANAKRISSLRESEPHPIPWLC